MSPEYRWPATLACYAAIALVVGGALTAIGLATYDPAPFANNGASSSLRVVGGIVIVLGLIWLVRALLHLIALWRD